MYSKFKTTSCYHCLLWWALNHSDPFTFCQINTSHFPSLPSWHLHSLGYFPVNSNFFWKWNPVHSENEHVYFTVSSWCQDVKITKLRYHHYKQVNVCMHMFISVTYGQIPSSCAPVNLPSPPEIPPRGFPSFSHPPRSYKQKLNKAMSRAFLSWDINLLLCLPFLHQFPHNQHHSNHALKVLLRGEAFHSRKVFPFKLPPGGPRPVRCFPRGQPRNAGARPRIPGALLPPGAALPPHGPGAAGNHPLALGCSSAALWGQLRQPEGLGALPAHPEGAGPIPALLAAAPRPCPRLPHAPRSNSSSEPQPQNDGENKRVTKSSWSYSPNG